MVEKIVFGDWEVDYAFGISNKKYSYNIPAQRLWETRSSKDGVLWDWLCHLCQKTWVDKRSFADLVTCFTFAHNYFQQYKPDDLPNVSMAQTIYHCHVDLTINEYTEKESIDEYPDTEEIVSSMNKDMEMARKISPLVIPTD